MNLLTRLVDGIRGKVDTDNEAWFGPTVSSHRLFNTSLTEYLNEIGFKPSVFGKFSKTALELVAVPPLTLDGYFEVYTRDDGFMVDIQNSVVSKPNGRRVACYISLEATQEGLPGHKTFSYATTAEKFRHLGKDNIPLLKLDVSVDYVMKALGLAPQLPMGKN